MSLLENMAEELSANWTWYTMHINVRVNKQIRVQQSPELLYM